MDKKKTTREVVGTVVSDKMDKTRVIQLKQTQSHRLYHKNILKHRRYFIHDEKNESQKGDMVKAVSVRPLSKNKCFRLIEIVQKRSIA